MHPLAGLDHKYIWHPFTQMRDWLRREPVVIVSGKGATLRDVHGREYLDANSSIWTNLHGHNHPRINAALRRQLKKIAHSSALGLANEPASLLAASLVGMANHEPRITHHEPRIRDPKSASRVPNLSKVFFSDDGSTALEVALKLAYEFARRTGRGAKPKFLSLTGAYHGDTVGAMSVSADSVFTGAFKQLLFSVVRAHAPYCFRCPLHLSRNDCQIDCLDDLGAQLTHHGDMVAGVIVEPMLQGAGGMIVWPADFLAGVRRLCDQFHTLMIADEVLTGFGRTGSWWAVDHRGVVPDLITMAKGLTSSYVPLGAVGMRREIAEFYRDLGYDADLEYIKPYLHPDGIRRNVGLKYHRITGEVPLHAKEPYDPAAALAKADEHAGNFVYNRNQQAKWLGAKLGAAPTIVSPYDAELFGHWWFEGPRFLESVARRMAHPSAEVALISPSEVLTIETRLQTLEPSMSTWGDKGYAEVWLNGSNDWMIRHQHRAEDRMVELARRRPQASGLERRALNQAARELLLAQSGDWAFLITVGTASPYGHRRFREHITRFTRLADEIERGSIDEGSLREVEGRDTIFSEMDFRVYA